jgi:hypothetical protein
MAAGSTPTASGNPTRDRAGPPPQPGAHTWYAVIGSAAAGLALAAATTSLRCGVTARRPAVLAAAATVGHVLITAWAARLNFSQRGVGDDPAALTRIFDRFAALNAVRAGLQVTALAAVVGMLDAVTLPAAQSSGLDG